MSLLAVSGLTKQIEGIPVVQDISFSLQRFQKIAIAGETGSGKSTLLKMIAGLVQPTAGSILFNGEKVVGPDFQLLPGHPGIAYLSQHYELRHNYRMEELLEYANKLPQEQADRLFKICRIDHLFKRKSHQLSGGEKQRIALARLLVGSPSLLLLDEPFSNLDPIHKNILKNVLSDMGELLQLTCILTSHDPLDTLAWADEIKLMWQGRIIQEGKPAHLYHQPANEYAAGLLGGYTLADAELANSLGMGTAGMPEGKKLLIRPGQLAVMPRTEGLAEGVIRAAHFRGFCVELEILISGVSLQAITMDPVYRVGDKVSVQLKPGPAWYL
jgi:iron(III) transport system ATP-binding protein